MTTIYGFKRPDGSVVVDTRWRIQTDALLAALKADDENDHALPDDATYTTLEFILGPDGSITPKE